MSERSALIASRSDLRSGDAGDVVQLIVRHIGRDIVSAATTYGCHGYTKPSPMQLSSDDLTQCLDNLHQSPAADVTLTTNALRSEKLRHRCSVDNQPKSNIREPNWRFLGFFSALHAMPVRTSDENGVRLSVYLSVRPSVCLSNACIMTKWKKDLSRFLYHTKDHLVLQQHQYGSQ